MISREKVKFRNALASILVIAIFVFGSITVGAAGKKFYWLVTDGNIDPNSVSVEYFTIWTGQGLEEKIAVFQWYVDSGSNRGAPSLVYSEPVGGVKGIASVTSIGNNLQLNIYIYKGGANNPSIGPEVYKWTIINGKDSTNDCINLVFTDTISGTISKVLSLYENDIMSISIPRSSDFNCRMWLI